MIRHTNKTLLILVKYISLIISLIIFSYVLFVHFFRLIKPSQQFVDPKAFDITYLWLLIFLGLTLAGISWISALILKQLKPVNPNSHTLEDRIFIGLSAFFLAIFYAPVFSFLGLGKYFLFMATLLFFYFFIPQIIELNLSCSLKEIKHLFSPNFGRNETDKIEHLKLRTFNTLGMLLFITVSTLMIIFSFYFLSETAKDYALGKTYQENLDRRLFYVKEVKPLKALHADKIKLSGYNFGWKTDNKSYRVMTDKGQLSLVEEWTNEHLDFIVPLDLPTGKRLVWIERPNTESNNKKILKSNKSEFEVYSRFIFYPEIDDTNAQKIIKRVNRILFYKIRIFNNFLFTKYE